MTHAETPISSVDGEPQEVKDRCNQLYSILTGLLPKGKPLRLLRQVSNRNGFEVWRQLCQLFMPGLEAVQFQFSCLDGCSEFHYKRQNLAGPGVGPRTHACRICSLQWHRHPRRHHALSACARAAKGNSTACAIAAE